MKPFILYLVTPERKLYEQEVSSVTLPVKEGQITVLSNHTPYIGALQAGEITVRNNDEKEEYIAISGGFVEFNKNRLVVLVETAEKSTEINEDRVKEAIKKAQEMKKQKNIQETDYAVLASKLEKEFARLRVVRRR